MNIRTTRNQVRTPRRRDILTMMTNRPFSLGNFSSSEAPCSRCDLTFATESQLSEHQKHAHPSPPPVVPSAPPSFKCSYCHTSFTSRTQLDRHSRIHIAASGNNLKCNICDRLFTSIDILSEHKLSHCKATTSNICSYCHQTLHNEADYTRHLYEHNHQSKSKMKLFTGHQETTPLTIACIVCKQSLINEREIDLHAKFHLTSPLNKTSPTRPVDSSPLTFTCHGCRRSSTTNREFFIELPSFTVHCFQCLAKALDPSGKRSDRSHFIRMPFSLQTLIPSRKSVAHRIPCHVPNAERMFNSIVLKLINSTLHLFI